MRLVLKKVRGKCYSCIIESLNDYVTRRYTPGFRTGVGWVDTGKFRES